MSIVSRVTILVLLAATLPQLVSAQNSADSPLAQQCKSLRLDPDAPWRTIPWQTDLLDAQHLAVQQQKPIFVWAMDGHPLGCT